MIEFDFSLRRKRFLRSKMEDRIERERKVWNEHKEILIAGERTKFEEEKARTFKDLQNQLNVEHDRFQQLETKLYDTQIVRFFSKSVQSNSFFCFFFKQLAEAQSVIKEMNRERINGIYAAKEQCRKEFQDEIHRLRNQFQAVRRTDYFISFSFNPKGFNTSNRQRLSRSNKMES